MLLIASGWTLTYKDIFERDHYLLIGVVVLATNGGVAFLGYLDHGEHHKFHDYSGWPGVFLILIRFAIYTLFILRANDTERLMPKRHTQFFRRLKFAGSVYILSFPFFYFVSWMVQPYLRHRVIVFGHYFAQLVSTQILLHQLTKRGSKYAEASGKTGGILPGGKGL